jgi:hypothetical protein
MNSKRKLFITSVACAAFFLMINVNLKVAARFLHSLNEMAEQQFGEFTGTAPFASAQLSSLLMPAITEELSAQTDASIQTAQPSADSEVSNSPSAWFPVKANLVSCQAIRPDAFAAKNKTSQPAQRKHSKIVKRIPQRIPTLSVKPVSPGDVVANVFVELPDVVTHARVAFDRENHLSEQRQMQRMQEMVEQELNRHEREFIYIRTTFSPNSK